MNLRAAVISSWEMGNLFMDFYAQRERGPVGRLKHLALMIYYGDHCGRMTWRTEKMNVGTEEFRDVAGWPGYRIGNFGTLLSCRTKHGAIGSIYRRYHGTRDEDGYLRVILSVNGRRTYVGIHKLVALAFLGPPPTPDLMPCHENGIGDDNRADNLRWDTCKGNLADRSRHGTLPIGEKHHNSKFTESQILTIRELVKSGKSFAYVGRLFGANYTTISRIYRRKLWAHVE